MLSSFSFCPIHIYIGICSEIFLTGLWCLRTPTITVILVLVDDKVVTKHSNLISQP